MPQQAFNLVTSYACPSDLRPLLLLRTDAAAAAAAAIALQTFMMQLSTPAVRRLILNDRLVVIYTDYVCQFINFNRVSGADVAHPWVTKRTLLLLLR